MSEVVERFPPPTHAKYDWELWTDGQIHKCVRGVDFDTEPRRFMHAASNWACRHEMTLRSIIRGDEVYLCFSPKRGRGRPPAHPPSHPQRIHGNACEASVRRLA